jgi:peptidyl-prolyl cis-trans isomerase SurA
MSVSRLRRLRRAGLTGVLFFSVVLVTACGSKPGSAGAAPPSVAPDVWAVVDGRELKRDAIEKAYRRAAPTAPSSEDEVLAAKLSLLDELITQDILLARAKAANLAPTAAEIDKAFAERKGGMTEDAFQKLLAERGLTAEDMKDGVRQQLTVQKVLERDVSSKVAVTDQDIKAFFDAHRSQFNLAETSYHIAQIVVTPIRDPQLANRLNDDATTQAEADRKAQMLMERLKGGTRFSEVAMDYSEDPQTAAQGGDLGLVPASALNQVPAPLRDAVLKSQPGTVSVVSQGGGHTLVLLISKEPGGQRDLNSPGVRENISTSLQQRKDQLLRIAYLSTARNEAKVVNYLARRIVESQGKVPPTLMPSGPGK